MLEELGYYISRGLLENGKALANLANLVLPAVLTACDLADAMAVVEQVARCSTSSLLKIKASHSKYVPCA